MSGSGFQNIIWASDAPEHRATQVRAAAAAWSWKQERAKRRCSGNASRGRPSRRLLARSANDIAIPPLVTLDDPATRFFPTFFPRFVSLIGPDALECINQLIQPTSDQLVREAYDALVVGVSSNLSFDEQLKSSAARRYGDVLPRMTDRLQNMRVAKSTDTSSLIFLLGVEEAMVWKSFKSSQTHIEGWGRLIQMRGPESFTTQADLFTLRMFRLNAVALHLLARKPCFLAAKEWRTIPWTTVPKNLFDHAMDLLVQIPDLVASVDLFRKGALKPAAMNAQVQTFIIELKSWKEYFLYPTARSLLLDESLDLDLDSLTSMIQNDQLVDFTFARGLTHYLAAILLISRFGPPYVSLLPFPPDACAESIFLIGQKMTLQTPQNERDFASRAALWPWIQPLRIACFSSGGNEETSRKLVGLCRKLERTFEWKILDSERHKMFQDKDK